MSLRKQFKMDANLEQDGIWIDYGTARIRIARAGGNNKKFAKVLDTKTKPYKRAIVAGMLDAEKSNAILREVYADAVILKWETNTGTEAEPVWEPGILPEDLGCEGETLLPATKENIVKVLAELPELFTDLIAQASSATLFREELSSDIAKN